MFVHEPSGPHSVAALDVLTGCGKDSVLARIFYPTSDAIGNGCQYTEPEYLAGLVDFVRWSSWLSRPISWCFQRLRLCCAWQGALLPGNEQLPIIVYSHGLGGQRYLYSSLYVELASRGFVVAAVEHRDSSASMTFTMEPDGGDGGGGGGLKRSWLPFWRHQLSDFPERNRQVRQRADECGRLTDLLLQLHATGSVANCLPGLHPSLLSQFQGRLDVNRIHIMGHSFGGATAFTAPANDEKSVYKTCCLHDIWMHPVDPELYQSLKLPTLFLHNEKFHWETNVNRMKSVQESMAAGQWTNLTIRGTNHAAQSDSGLYVSCWLSRKLGLIDTMHPRDAIILTATVSCLFIDKHEGRQLSKEDQQLLNGEDPRCYDDFTFVPDNARSS